MTPLAMVQEWKRGCSCATPGKPEECAECTRGFLDALEPALKRQLAEAHEALAAANRLFEEALPKFNWGASALDANAIRLLNEVPAKGLLQFVADNPEGVNRDIVLPSVTLSPNGDFAIKGDGTDWQTLELTLEVLKKNSATPAVIIDGRPA